MQQTVGFRNACVHEYREIRQEAVYRNLKNALDPIERFLAAVAQHLEKSS